MNNKLHIKYTSTGTSKIFTNLLGQLVIRLSMEVSGSSLAHHAVVKHIIMGLQGLQRKITCRRNNLKEMHSLDFPYISFVCINIFRANMIAEV